MFILRTVFTYGQGSEVKETTNRLLGNTYQVYLRDSHYFQGKVKSSSTSEHAFGILLADEREVELLYDTPYYVMTGDGQTFEKLYSSSIEGIPSN